MRNFENISRIKIFIKDPNKKSFLKIIKEVCILLVTKKEIPFYYFKYLYRKNVKNYLDYLSTKEVVAIGNSKLLHNPEYKALFENKLFFALFCKKTSLNTPKLVSYNLGNNFHFNNTIEVISDKNQFFNFFENIFTTSNLEGLFFRPPSGYGGKGCFKLTRENLIKDIDAKYDIFLKGCFVHTEIIKQHEEINKIHNKSVSTLRIISFITPENHIEIISAFIRFGVGDSVVDNSSSGGFFVGINLKEGTLKQTGHYMLDYGGGEIHKHPNSGFKFEGFKVPYFKEACDEVIKGVKIIPDRFIGWDVAITPDGPTIVEANEGPHLFMVDMGYGGLLQNHHIKNLIRELKTIK